jgi:nucleoside-diphosphate-sugar epimerase
MDRDMTYLITGAGGFIGGWLAEYLLLNETVHVRAGIHNWIGAVRPARFPMDIVLCDILDAKQIDEAMRDVDCVIHCAKGPSQASIIQGTRNMLESAIKANVKRFVYISTTEVYGRPHGNINETYPCQTIGDVYGDSKGEAESVCWEYYKNGLPVTIIRPPIVYGPFSKTWTVGIALRLLSGNWGVFEKQGDGICNLIYITDLIKGILAACQNEAAIGEVFNLNGSELLTWNQYFQKFNAALGLPELKVIESGDAKLKAALIEPLRTVAKFARDHFGKLIKNVASKNKTTKQLLKQLEKNMKTAPRLEDFNLFNREVVYSSTKAHNLLGFNPAVDLEEGLKLTIPWLKQIGLVDEHYSPE